MSFQIEPPRRTDDGWECEVQVEAESPYFDGHFPGHPVLPGVAQMCLVDQVLTQIWNAEKDATGGEEARSPVVGFPQMRLRRQIKPGDRVRLVVSGVTEGVQSFRLMQGPLPITTGRVTLVGSQA